MTILLLSLLTLASTQASAATPREELNAAVAQVKAKPGDRALRVKAIALARKAKPAVPPEAKRAFVMAATYQKEAKSPADFTLAIDSFQDALKAAPWWGDAYYNLSVSLESAGRLDEAKDALELYLLTKPKDAEAAQNRVYALDAKKNMAAKKAAEAASVANAEAEAAAAKTRAENSIEGAWFSEYGLKFTVTRGSGGFEVKTNYLDATVKDLRANETTLHFVENAGIGVNTYDFRREGSLLVGTEIAVIGNQQWNRSHRLFRK